MQGTIKTLLQADQVSDGDAYRFGGVDVYPQPHDVTFQAVVTGSGAVAATVHVEGSHDGVHWVEIAELDLGGTDSDTTGYREQLAWPLVRARCSAISGTGAAVKVTMAN